MVLIRGLLLFLSFTVVCSSCYSYEATTIREGVYLDLRGQIRSSYNPPHPENIPIQPALQQPVSDAEMYYKINQEGYRGAPNKVRPVPGGTVRFCTRRAHPYTKEQYMAVWAEGKKVGNVYLTKQYAMSYFFIDSWATGVIAAKIKARKFHKQAAVFFFIEELQNADIRNAQKMAEQFGVVAFFGTIDKRIPAEWSP